MHGGGFQGSGRGLDSRGGGGAAASHWSTRSRGRQGQVVHSFCVRVPQGQYSRMDESSKSEHLLKLTWWSATLIINHGDKQTPAFAFAFRLPDGAGSL